MPAIKLLIVDDHPAMRSGLTAILDDGEDFRVVGEAGSAEQALREVERLSPQVVLMDVRMEPTDGIAACRLIKQDYPEVDVLMFTSSVDEKQFEASIEAGASGYVLKARSLPELRVAIKEVADGGIPWDPAMNRKVFDTVRGRIIEDKQRLVQALSDREKEVVILVAEGQTNKEIAGRLVISENTARNHVSRILDKLDLANRAQLAAWAAANGLVEG